MIAFFKFPLVDTLGGAEFHTLKLAKYFQSAGKEVRLFTSDKKLLKLFAENNLPAQYIFAGWEPTSIWYLLLWPATYLIAKHKFQRLLKTIPLGSTLFMQSLTEKLILTPLLLSTPSSSPPYQGGERVGVWLEHKIPGRWLKLNPLKYRYLRLSRKVETITVSNFAKQEFVKFGVADANIEVIYPGVSMAPSSPPPREGEKKGVVVGVLSRLDPEKGVYDFLKALIPHLPNHPNWKILIAGEGREKQKIINIIDKYNQGRQIELLGWTKNRDHFFSQISVLVYPTKVPESFGIAVLEAMAHGIPVVASNLGALPEIIEHGKNGFLVPLFPPSPFAGEGGVRGQWINFLKLLQNPELYRKLSRNALVSAQKFSEIKMFESFDLLVGTYFKNNF